jgi:hypothetical protein
MKRYSSLILVVDAWINGTGAFFVPAAHHTQTTAAQSLPTVAPSPEVTASTKCTKDRLNECYANRERRRIR